MPWQRYLTFALIAAFVVTIVTLALMPSMARAFGWLLIVLGSLSFASLALRLKRPATSATTQLDPGWKLVLSGIALVLMGAEYVWPQYPVGKFGIGLMLATMLPGVIRRYRETDGDSIV